MEPPSSPDVRAPGRLSVKRFFLQGIPEPSRFSRSTELHTWCVRKCDEYLSTRSVTQNGKGRKEESATIETATDQSNANGQLSKRKRSPADLSAACWTREVEHRRSIRARRSGPRPPAQWFFDYGHYQGLRPCGTSAKCWHHRRGLAKYACFRALNHKMRLCWCYILHDFADAHCQTHIPGL